jgi:nitrite reductase/ring-hydroxylating ferredoxin subunit
MARQRQRFRIGKSQDFTTGRMQIVALADREIGVTRLHTGELRAIANRCPHKGAPVCRGIVGGVWDSSGPGEMTFDNNRDVLMCPWHGFAFDLATGKEDFWKQPASLRMYPIEDSGGEVFVMI